MEKRAEKAVAQLADGMELGALPLRAVIAHGNNAQRDGGDKRANKIRHQDDRQRERSK